VAVRLGPDLLVGRHPDCLPRSGRRTPCGGPDYLVRVAGHAPCAVRGRRTAQG
jgi:hypothetical protein